MRDAGGVRGLSAKAKEAMGRSLFVSVEPVVMGAIVLCAATLICAVRGADVAWAGFVALAVIGTIRCCVVLSWVRARSRPRGAPPVAPWRRAYAVGMLASSGTIGAVTGATVATSGDVASHMVLVATAVGYASSVAGRNAACPEVALPQLWAALLPTAAGLALNGSWPHAVLAGLVLAFCLGMDRIARSIHATIAEAHLGAQEREAIADRFDAALASMPHGFALLGPGGLVEAGSESLARMLGVPALAAGIQLGGSASASSCAAIAEAALGDAVTVEREVRTVEGRVLRATASPRPGGGCVLVVEDTTDRAEAAARLARMAATDGLTGLYNRAGGTEALSRLTANDAPVAVALVDLDRFKAINDGHGHAVGDALLRDVADRIAALLPPGGVAARLGGDEFLVVAPTGPGAGTGEGLAAALASGLDAPYAVSGRVLSVGASVGLAVHPADGADPTALLRGADVALYDVKATGRGGWRRFDASMDEAERRRRELAADLAEAVAHGALDVVYQPQVDAATRRAVSCEALVRWSHPVRGGVSPSEFIPVAESSGLVVEIGRFVLERACRDAAGWDPSMRVAVNVSAVQFRSDLTGTVAAVLAATGLPASRLELEVTESVFLEDGDEVAETFRRLRAMGVGLSLDDFGTGYSSLGYLRSFPFKKVKIDRSFVTGIDRPGEGRAVVRAVVGLGEDFGMQVVAEGVETEAELAALRDLGCSLVQGYLTGRPVDATAIGRLSGALAA